MNRLQIEKLVSQYENQISNGVPVHLNEESFLKLIEHYEKKGNLNKALLVIEEALSKYLFSVDFYIRKAELLMDMGKEEAALEVLGDANTFAPGSVEINLLKAEALNYLGKKEEALQVLNDSKVNVPKSILSEVLLMESLVYEHNDEYDEMFDALKKAVIYDPKNKEVVERFGISTEFTGRYEEAIVVNEAAIDAHPYAHLAWYNLGNAHQNLGQMDEAVDAYEFVLAIDDKFEYAYYDCAAIRFDQEAYADSIGYYLDLLKIVQPSDKGDLHFKIGACYHLLAQYSNAKKHLLIAQKTSVFQDRIYYLLGNCSLMEGLSKEAAYYYNKAISLEPDNGEYYSNLAEVKIIEEDYHAARDCYEKAVSLNPDSLQIWIDYIVFYFDLGYTDKAFAVLDMAAKYLEVNKVKYIKVAFLFLAGKRNEGSVLLWEALSEDYESYKIIFKIAPELEDDSDIRAIIAVV